MCNQSMSHATASRTWTSRLAKSAERIDGASLITSIPEYVWRVVQATDLQSTVQPPWAQATTIQSGRSTELAAQSSLDSTKYSSALIDIHFSVELGRAKLSLGDVEAQQVVHAHRAARCQSQPRVRWPIVSLTRRSPSPQPRSSPNQGILATGTSIRVA